MADISTLTIRINADTGNVTGEFRKLESEAKSSFGSLSTMAVAAGTALGNLAAQGLQAVGRYAVDAMKDVIALGGTLSDMSAKTGVSMKALQEWGFAAEDVGSSLETVVKATTTLGTKLIENSQGTRDALKGLGLSVTDLLAMNPEQRFETVAAALAKIEDPAARSAASTALLGKAGLELDPAIQNFAALTAEAEKLGIAISDETLLAADEFGKQLDILSKQGQALIAEFLKPLLPLIAQAASAFTSWAKDAMPFVRTAIEQIILAFTEFDTGLQKMVRGIAEAQLWLPNFGALHDNARAAIERANATIDANNARLDAMANAADQTGPPISAMNQNIGTTAKVTDDASAALKKYNEELKKLSGAAAAEDIAKLVEQIGKIGGVQKIATSETGRIAKAMLDFIETTEDAGGTVTKEFREMQLAVSMRSREIIRDVKAIQEAMSDLATSPTGRPGFGAAATADLFSEGIEEAAQRTADAAKAIKGTLFALVDSVPTLPVSRIFAQGEVDQANASAETLKQSMAGLANAVGDAAVQAIAGGGNIAAAMAAAGSGQILSMLHENEKAFGRLGKAMGVAAVAAQGFVTGMQVVQQTGSRAAGAAAGFVSGLLAGAPLGPGGAIVGGIIGLAGALLTAGESADSVRESFIAANGGLGQLRQTLDTLDVPHELLQDVLRAETVNDVNLRINALTYAVRTAQQATAAFVKELGRVNSTGAVLGRDMITQLSNVRQGTQEAAAAFEFFQQQTQMAAGGITTFLQNATVSSQASATALSSSLGVLFEDLRLQGYSAAEAFQILGPAITTLQAQLTATGYEGSAAFIQLAEQARLAADPIAGPLYAAVAGVGDLMTGLANTGRLNQEIFSGLTKQITDTWAELVKMGKGGTTSLANMQPELQTVWELQQDFGFAVDESTQELLDMATQSGLVGDQFRSSSDKMMAAIQELVTRMGDLITVLESSLPNAAGAAARGIEDELGSIDVPEIEVRYRFVPQNEMETGGGGGGGGGGTRAAYGAPTALTPTGLTGSAAGSVNVIIDGERIAEVATRYSGRVLAPYGVGVD